MPEPNAHGQIEEFLRVLHKRRWQILLPAVFVLTLGAAFAVIVPKKYVLETRVEIRESRVESDYALRDPQSQATVRELPNVLQHVRHYNRIKQVIELQKELWPEYVRADVPGDFVRSVMENIDAEPVEKDRSQGLDLRRHRLQGRRRGAGRQVPGAAHDGLDRRRHRARREPGEERAGHPAEPGPRGEPSAHGGEQAVPRARQADGGRPVATRAGQRLATGGDAATGSS